MLFVLFFAVTTKAVLLTLADALVAGGTILAIQPVLIPFLAVIFLACLLPTGMEMCIRDRIWTSTRSPAAKCCTASLLA